MIFSVPRFARAAQHHVGLLIMVSGRSKPTSPSKVTLLYYYGPTLLTVGSIKALLHGRSETLKKYKHLSSLILHAVKTFIMSLTLDRKPKPIDQ